VNVDGCRIAAGAEYQETARANDHAFGGASVFPSGKVKPGFSPSTGRFPANLIHDGSAEVVGLFPVTSSGIGKIKKGFPGGSTFGGGKMNKDVIGTWFNDTGSAARFFYTAKASKADRDAGCEGLEERKSEVDLPQGGIQKDNRRGHMARNHHPTVKPLSLMRYLVRLITPPGGLVLDPFMGSGSTGKACYLEGFRFTGIDLEPEHVAIAIARLEHIQCKQGLFADQQETA
jgi:site-specific DNA-methyltransferase (adenine-specific)